MDYLRAEKIKRIALADSSASKDVTATLIFATDAFASFHLEDVVCLNWIKRALSVLTDQSNRVLRFATLVDDSQGDQEGGAA